MRIAEADRPIHKQRAHGCVEEGSSVSGFLSMLPQFHARHHNPAEVTTHFAAHPHLTFARAANLARSSLVKIFGLFLAGICCGSVAAKCAAQKI
jgi:hypothetical protein